MRLVRLSVPASTANLGSGFDSLGLGLELRNSLEMEVVAQGLDIEIEGEGERACRVTKQTLWLKPPNRFSDRLGRNLPGCDCGPQTAFP